MATATTTQPIKVVCTDNTLKLSNLEAALMAALEAANYKSIEELHGQFILYDLSASYWHQPDATLWLLMLMNKLKIQENDQQLLFPEPTNASAEQLWSYLIRWKFFEALDACVDDPVNLLTLGQVSYRQKTSKYGYSIMREATGTETNLLSDKSRVFEITVFGTKRPETSEKEDGVWRFLERDGEKLLANALTDICGWPEGQAGDFVHLVAGEAIHNCLLHSRGSFATVMMKMAPKDLFLAVGDNGIGIPAVLRSVYEKAGKSELRTKTDSEILDYYTDPQFLLDSFMILASVKPGVSSRTDRKGMGLYYLKKHVLEHNGELKIRSGRASVEFTSTGQLPKDDLLLSPGTVVRVAVPKKARDHTS